MVQLNRAFLDMGIWLYAKAVHSCSCPKWFCAQKQFKLTRNLNLLSSMVVKVDELSIVDMMLSYINVLNQLIIMKGNTTFFGNCVLNFEFR